MEKIFQRCIIKNICELCKHIIFAERTSNSYESKDEKVDAKRAKYILQIIANHCNLQDFIEFNTQEFVCVIVIFFFRNDFE